MKSKKDKNSKNRYKSLIENARVGIVRSKLKDGTIVETNKFFARLLGYDETERVIGNSFIDYLVSPEDRKKVVSTLKKRGFISNKTTKVRKMDGEIAWLEGTAHLDDTEEFIETIFLDRTEEERIKQTLKQSKSKYKTLFESTGAAFCIFKDDRIIKMCNKQFEKLAGTDRENIEGKLKWSDFVSEKDLDRMLRYHKMRTDDSGEPPSEYEFEFIDKKGNKKYVFLKIGIVPETRERVASLIDITELKKIELELKKSEEKYKSLIEHSNDAIYLLYDNKFKIINKSFEEMFGYSIEETNAPDFNFMNLVVPSSRQLIRERAEKMKKDKHLEPVYEFTAITKSGKKIECETSVRYIDYKDGKAVQGIVRNITSRKKMQRQLEKSEAKSRAILEAIPDLIFEFDKKGNFKSYEGLKSNLYKSPENFLGKNVKDILPERLATLTNKNITKTLSEGGIQVYEYELSIKGEKRRFESRMVRKEKQSVLALVRDITKRKRLEEQLRQSQKMEAIGRLAGGIAHDFNNLLTVINGYSSMLLEKVNKDSAIYGTLKEIASAGEKAEVLTNQLLAFSRRQILESKILNINNLLRKIKKMLRRIIGEDIKLKTDFSKEIYKIKADPGQLEQMIINIVVNARDAMSEGGILTIKTENVFIDKNYVMKHESSKVGEHVKLSISDTGYGMNEKEKSRIFEPFYTTKKKGTGLGLSTVYGIVKQSEGHIVVHSKKGEGTTFNVCLPRVKRKKKSLEKVITTEKDLSGTETILIVEDDSSVRRVIVEILQGFGYKVLQAPGGEVALDIIKEKMKNIDLVLTDMVMPDTRGDELADKILKIVSDIKIIYMTGYTNREKIEKIIKTKDVAFLQKPFSPNKLGRKIRELLDI